MPVSRRASKKTYTLEEKARLVGEIERMYRAGGRTYQSIAKELGVSDSSYHNWVKAGIRPTAEKRPAPPKIYSPEERERLRAEVDRLRASGVNLNDACRKVGISDSSYRKWKEATAPAPAMRPVEITALVPALPAPQTPATETLSLVAPGGYRIEGLSVESAATLLRALQ